MTNNQTPQMGTLHMFGRQQTASLIATTLDFLIYTLLIEVFSVWYVTAAAIAALCGAVCAFLLGRHWCFVAGDGHLSTQGFRYVVVASGSMLLNTGGVYFFTDFMGLHYLLSKVCIALLVSLFFNFPLQRYYVFEK